MQHPAVWDICGSATVTCLWNLWIRNNQLSSQSVNVYDSSHSWFCESVAFRFLLILHMLEIFHHLICFNAPFRKLAVVPLSIKINSNRRQRSLLYVPL
jgi:predicted phosphatase